MQHLAFLCAQFAKWTLPRAKASQFMPVPFSLPAPNHGRVPSSVQLAATRRTQWKANAQAESKYYSSRRFSPWFFIFSSSIKFLIAILPLSPEWSWGPACPSVSIIPFSILGFSLKFYLQPFFFWAAWLSGSRIDEASVYVIYLERARGNRW